MNLDVDVISLFSSTLSFNLLSIFFFSISIINHSNRLFRFIIQSINSSLRHYHHQYQSKLSMILNNILNLFFCDDKKKENSPLIYSFFLLNHIRASTNFFYEYLIIFFPTSFRDNKIGY